MPIAGHGESARVQCALSEVATKAPSGNFIPPEGLHGRRTAKATRRLKALSTPIRTFSRASLKAFAAELRGGMGGANGQHVENRRPASAAQCRHALDTIKAGYSGAINTMTGDQVGKSYLTAKTQKQQVRELHGRAEGRRNDRNVGSRLAHRHCETRGRFGLRCVRRLGSVKTRSRSH